MANVQFAQELLQWKVMDFAGNLKAHNKYVGGKGLDLFCKKNSRYLTYIKDTGVNLGFSTKGDNKVTFRLADGAEREILTGDVVAFGIGGDPTYLAYDPQPVGINLEYRSSPAYEWIIMDSTGQGGRPIRANSDIALANNKVDIGGSKAIDFLVYKQRLGADLAWTTSPDWKETIWGKVKEQGLKLAEKAVVAAIAA